jgi:hypothetical protein
MKINAIAALGAMVGVIAGGCWAPCRDTARPPLESAVLSTAIDEWGELPVDGTLDVDVDVDGSSVTVSYESGGRHVVERYRIASIDTR